VPGPREAATIFAYCYCSDIKKYVKWPIVCSFLLRVMMGRLFCWSFPS
jgi:hypothetical protein